MTGNSFFSEQQLNIDDLPDGISWLYRLPAERLGAALAQALQRGEGSGLETKVNFPAGHTLNAVAYDLSAERCAIGIYSSTPLLIWNACQCYAALCDHTTALPLNEQGMLATVLERPLLVHELDSSILSAADAADRYEEHRLSTSGVLFAKLLTEICLKYLSMHEAMHVILGHTGFAREHFGLAGILEFGAAWPVDGDLGFVQLLEFIADRNAVRGLMNRLWMKDLRYDYDILMAQASVTNECYLLRCLVQAVSLLFHFFPGNDQSIRTAGSHPHPYVRMRWLCNELAQELDGREIGFYEPLTAMSWAAAHLAYNFRTAYNWLAATAEDFDESSGQSFADNEYLRMQQDAKC